MNAINRGHELKFCYYIIDDSVVDSELIHRLCLSASVQTVFDNEKILAGVRDWYM